MELWLKSSDAGSEIDSCTVGIFDIRTNIEEQSEPINLICNCPIECPVSIKLASDDESALVNDTSPAPPQEISESDRLKHQKGNHRFQQLTQ